MVSAATFHVVATELAVGTIALAGAMISLRLILSFRETHPSRLSELCDSTSLVCVVAGLCALPFAIITGVLAAPGDGLDNPLLFNKMLLSWVGIGLFSAWFHGRFSMGPNLWNHRPAAVIQGLIGLAACGSILTVASLGGKFSRGESLMGPMSKPLEYSIELGTISSILVLIVSVAALISVLKLMPQPYSMEFDDNSLGDSEGIN